jgi:hypothetical protein
MVDVNDNAAMVAYTPFSLVKGFPVIIFALPAEPRRCGLFALLDVSSSAPRLVDVLFRHNH